MRKTFLSAVGLLLCSATLPAFAENNKSTLPDVGLYKAMLHANRETGWVQFRNFSGRQLIYFTALQSLHCRLSDIRYGINSKQPELHFPVAKCNPSLPFNLPPEETASFIYLSLPPGQVQSVSVQAVWADGTGSEILTYTPCPDVGEATCARLLDVSRPVRRKDAPTPSSAGR